MSDPLGRLSWDDLRVVKVIGEQGRLSLAAEFMGVNNSTLFRRITQIEKTIGITVFDRWRGRYVPTLAGKEIVALAQSIEIEIVGASTRLSDSVADHSGDLRITTSDSLAYHLVIPIIGGFKKQFPAIRAEVLIANQPFNLARGESDIAIRATPAPPENLFGRKVATIAWAKYRRHSEPPVESGPYMERWVSYSGSLSRLKAVKLVEGAVSPQDVAYRSDSVVGAAMAIEAGIGIGYLPCMLGDINSSLSRMGDVDTSLSEDLWILSHPDIRRSGRVQAFMAFCASAIAKQRKLISGKSPQRRMLS